MTSDDERVVRQWNDRDIESNIRKAERELARVQEMLSVLKAERVRRREEERKRLDTMDCTGLPLDHRAHQWPDILGHRYPEEWATSDCQNGCGCWMGSCRSGGPQGVDPFGPCPNAKPEDNVRKCEKCGTPLPEAAYRERNHQEPVSVSPPQPQGETPGDTR